MELTGDGPGAMVERRQLLGGGSFSTTPNVFCGLVELVGRVAGHHHLRGLCGDAYKLITVAIGGDDSRTGHVVQSGQLSV